MSEKIEWYKEVLELEPNSRVFFPLARLYASENEPAQAITVLEDGLARHPEFLEARLFLIELLHKSGQTEKCNAQVSRLSKMFASYAGFWEAWAACLASEPDEADTASIVRFLAAHFLTGPLYLHDVLNRGLQSLIEDAKKGHETASRTSVAAPEAAIAAEETKSGTHETVEKQDLMLEDVPQETPAVIAGEATMNSDLPMAEEMPQIDADTTHCEAQEPSEPEIVDASDVQENESETKNAEASLESVGEHFSFPPAEERPADDIDAGQSIDTEQAVQDESRYASAEKSDVANNEAEQELGIDNVMASAIDELELPEFNMEDLPAPVVDTEVAGTERVESDAIETVHSVNIEDTGKTLEPVVESTASAIEQPGATESMEDEAQEEPFSLRTRSMAEVLAEQGDIAGALDIYHELAANAADDSELELINNRIRALEATLNAGNDENSDETDVVSKSKEKLIGMLEALAQRVEARAQG